jgi:hypothetical protein
LRLKEKKKKRLIEELEKLKRKEKTKKKPTES